MAEASCSGSTPFKRLVDHQTTGFGQQDRLVDRTGASGSNSFRSSPAPTTSPNGFDAFVAANSVLPAFHHDPATRLAAHASNLQPVHPEFSRPSPVPDLSSWAADFSRFTSAQQRPAQARPMNQANMGYGSVFGMSNGASFMPPTNAHQQQHQQQQQPTGQSEFDEEMLRWMSLHGGGNMQDVDAMMDRMARELEQNEAALAAFEVQDGEEQQQQDETAGASLETKEEALPIVEREEHEEKETNGDVPRKSAVAEAAEKLLDCVKHEGGDKWQNSVFLSLMRDFRDGKKDIIGDEIRIAGGEPQQT